MPAHVLLIGTYHNPETGLYHGMLQIVGSEPIHLDPPFEAKSAALEHAYESAAQFIADMLESPNPPFDPSLN